MLAWISCWKEKRQKEEEEEVDGCARAPTAARGTKDAAKDLTGQELSGLQMKPKRAPESSSIFRSRRGPIHYSCTGPVSSESTVHSTSWVGEAGDEVVMEEEEAKEWVAQVEPGVHITFMSLPHGGNDLKRIRFSREMFDKWQAQRWWVENFDQIMELYNVQRFSTHALPSSFKSEDERHSYSLTGSTMESPATPSLIKERWPRNYFSRPMWEHGLTNYGAGGRGGETPSVDTSRTTTSSRDEVSFSLSNASEQETEWVEQDEPGVYITTRALADGTRELRRVRFRRERFSEEQAKTWWEDNRERIQTQYL